MAKGSHLVQVVRGKLGNMVLYRIQNSNDKDKQGSRAYVARINNPRTVGQASQRMIVANIMANYKQLSSVIRRGFEGVRYGGMSFQKFLSLNMKDYQGAYTVKGSQVAVPFPALISQGSLAPISVEDFGVFTENAATPLYKNPCAFSTDLVVPASFDAAMTQGAAARILVDANSVLKAGDQLTFVQVTVLPNGSFLYRTKSVVLDVKSDAATKGGMNFDDGQPVFVAVSNNVGAVCLFDPSVITDERVVAAGVIISRDGDTDSYERSTCRMAIDSTNDTLMSYYTGDALEAARSSYMSASSKSVDWPVDPEIEEDDEEERVTNKTVRALIKATLPANYEIEDLRGQTVLIDTLNRVDANGVYKALYRTVGGVRYIVNTNGEVAPLKLMSTAGAYVSKDAPRIPVTACDLSDSPAEKWAQYYTRYGSY